MFENVFLTKSSKYAASVVPMSFEFAPHASIDVGFGHMPCSGLWNVCRREMCLCDGAGPPAAPITVGGAVQGWLQPESLNEHVWDRPEPSQQEQQVQPDPQLEMGPPSRAWVRSVNSPPASRHLA